MQLRRLFLVLVLGWTAVAADVRSQQAIGVDQVIEGEELRRLGVTRLGDIAKYIDAGRVMTIDGFSHRTSINGLGSFHAPGPDLFVDGHAIDISLFDTEALNLLGIPIEAVDRIEVATRPTLVFGSFAGRGAIHIRTRPAPNGLRSALGAAVENEVGDPGPFAFVDDRPNIDTQGPDARIMLEGGTEAVGARASAGYQRHYLTKPAILQQLGGLQNPSDAPVTETFAPGASVAWQGRTVGVSALVLGLRSKLYPFLTYAARPASVEYDAINGSTIIQHTHGENTFFRHRLAAHVTRAHEPDDSILPFRWEEQSFGINTAWGRSMDHMIAVLGGTARMERAGLTAESDRYTGSLYAVVGGSLAPSAEYRGGGVVTMDGRNVAVKAYVGVAVIPNSRHRGEVYFSIADDLPREESSADSWHRRNVDVPLMPGHITRPPDEASFFATADAEWRWEPAPLQEVSGGFGVRVADETYAFERRLARVGGTFQATGLAYDYAAGTNGIVWMQYATGALPGRQRAFLHYDGILTGNDAFRRLRQAVPSWHAGVLVYLPLAADFEVQARLAHQSSSFWGEFRQLSGAAADVSSASTLDLAFSKRLLAGRLHVRFALLNLLRDDVRYHPFGDTFDLSARIDVRIDLGATP